MEVFSQRYYLKEKFCHKISNHILLFSFESNNIRHMKERQKAVYIRFHKYSKTNSLARKAPLWIHPFQTKARKGKKMVESCLFFYLKKCAMIFDILFFIVQTKIDTVNTYNKC